MFIFGVLFLECLDAFFKVLVFIFRVAKKSFFAYISWRKPRHHFPSMARGDFQSIQIYIFWCLTFFAEAIGLEDKPLKL
ncbi:hypothetical protein SUGI_0294390 [Cryptomeria japonica]|nr:hypothetical protein SUGI_0294390 [Cryptomeria japonica]